MTCDPSRREFLKSTGYMGLGAVALSPAFQALCLVGGKADVIERGVGGLKEVDTKYYDRLSANKTKCHICPLHCILRPGETCFCRTRTNHDGRLYCHAYANPCVIAVDPLEKLPLYHYLPGRKNLSVAFGGCNMRCLYCQNWRLSQVKPHELETYDLPCDKALETAEAKALDIIAYAYTEPVVYSEYVRDLSALSRPRGIKNVAATALYIEEPPLRELCRTVDAFSVALKGFDEKFYRDVIGSNLKPVLKAMEVLKEEKVWFEIVNLVLPTYNDDPRKIKKMCKWIVKNLGNDVPIHFGRFVPEYKLKDLVRTPVSTLERCREIALDAGMKYPYIFNVSPHEGNHTFCPKCDRKLVQRLGLKVLDMQIIEGYCPHCNEPIPGVWI